MAWIQPKTDWKGGPAASGGDVPSSDDFNRIEGNIATLGNLRGFPTAGGTGTAIILTTGVFELVDGRAITFIASAANSKAATTINIDNTGALPLYRPGTTQAPNIIAGKAYTVWYSAANGCFFLKASAEGDAQAGDVLAGKLFSNDDDTNIVGTMPNLAGDSAALASSVSGNTLKLRPPKGYKDGVDDTISITDANFIAGNIRNNVLVHGLKGTFKGPRIYAQLAQPYNPVPGDIWVKANINPTSIVMKTQGDLTSEPASSTELWLIPLFHSNVDWASFSYTMTNITTQMYGLYTARYGKYGVNLQIIEEIYLFNGSTWVRISPKKMIYGYGYDPYNFIIQATSWADASPVTLTKEVMALYGQQAATGSGKHPGFKIGPDNAIDLTGYSTLCGLVANAGGDVDGWQIGIDADPDWAQGYMLAYDYANSRTIASLSLASYQGLYYPRADIGGTYHDTLQSRLYAMWLN